MCDKMKIHEAHLREAGVPELANISQTIRNTLVSILKKFAEMASKDP